MMVSRRGLVGELVKGGGGGVGRWRITAFAVSQYVDRDQELYKSRGGRPGLPDQSSGAV